MLSISGIASDVKQGLTAIELGIENGKQKKSFKKAWLQTESQELSAGLKISLR